MDDIEFQNDFNNAEGFVKYRSRMERSAGDPLIGMEDMIDDEFGSNASRQLPMLLSTNIFEDIEDMSRDVCKARGNAVLEVATASEGPENRLVDGEVEMEDASLPLNDDGTLPNNFLKKDVKFQNPGRYLKSMPNKQSVFPPLPDVPPPPLPIGPPPLTPPLPLDPPPSLPPLPLALLPPLLPLLSLSPLPPPPPPLHLPPHLLELPPPPPLPELPRPPFLPYLPEIPTLPSLPSSLPLPLFQHRPYHRLPSLPWPPKYSLPTAQAPLDHFSYVKPLLPQNIQQQPYNNRTLPSLADGWKQCVPDDKWRMHSSARKAGGYLETSSSQMGYYAATGSSFTTGRSVPFGPSELDLGYSQMSPSGFDVSVLNNWRPG